MEQVLKILDLALKVSVVLFMVGNLLDMGLNRVEANEERTK